VSHIESTVLRDRLVKVLRSDACQSINFDVLNIRVRGSAYGQVGSALGADASNGISLEINPDALNRGNAVAEYNGGTKVFVFMSESVGAGHKAAADNMVIVHEATHAQIDLTAGSTLDHLGTEVAAFIAGAAYNHLTGRRSKSDDKIEIAADPLGSVVANSNGYCFAPNEIGALIRAIKQFYPEADDDIDPDALRKFELFDPEGQWEVLASKIVSSPPRWRWVYTFNPNGQVQWEDPLNGYTGRGKWRMKRSDVRMHITWDSGSKDVWIPPAISENITTTATTMVGDGHVRGEGTWKLIGSRL